jgi:DNA-directed RNA polymerase subunit M/transcription elongation factor TFIIS
MSRLQGKEKRRLETVLQKHFSKQHNIDYILRRTGVQMQSATPAPFAEGEVRSAFARDGFENDQLLKIYEIMCILSTEDRTRRVDILLDYLNNDKLLWAHPIFDEERKRIVEENDFMTQPYEISEGVLQCAKCHCRKIFSFSKQTRSADEPTTVFALCSNTNCNHRWCEGS